MVCQAFFVHTSQTLFCLNYLLILISLNVSKQSANHQGSHIQFSLSVAISEPHSILKRLVLNGTAYTAAHLKRKLVLDVRDLLEQTAANYEATLPNTHTSTDGGRLRAHYKQVLTRSTRTRQKYSCFS